MKYHYFYQTKQNESRDGWIAAWDRHEAYDKLRKQGIKPYKLLGRNPLAWKRWLVIALLLLVVGALVPSLLRMRREMYATRYSDLPRAQLYGDPATIQHLAAEGWRGAFSNAYDAWFAAHVIPGRECTCQSEIYHQLSPILSLTPRLTFSSDDSDECRRLKRMINGMKSELKAYVAAGGQVEDYMRLCCERLRTEQGIRETSNRKLMNLFKKGDVALDEIWEKENRLLRSFGLATILKPWEDSSLEN